MRPFKLLAMPTAVMQVSLKKYGKTSPSAFGLTGRKTIAIVRSSGKVASFFDAMIDLSTVLFSANNQPYQLARKDSCASLPLGPYV